MCFSFFFPGNEHVPLIESIHLPFVDADARLAPEEREELVDGEVQYAFRGYHLHD